jgi:addiction module HigA family antidote
MSRVHLPSLTTPGRILVERYLKPHNIKIAELAVAAGLSRKHVSDIVNGRVGVTADTALRFGRALGTSPSFWLELQAKVDLDAAERKLPADAVRPLVLAPAAIVRPGAKRSPAEAADRLLERRNRFMSKGATTIREMIEFGRD